MNVKEFENVNLETILNIVISNLSVSIEENNATITHDPLPTYLQIDHKWYKYSKI